jgi:hypothetical protein
MIKNFTQYIKENKEPLVQSEISKSGKGVFKSFLKTLSALNTKDIINNNKGMRDGFLAIYEHNNVDFEDLKDVFRRYKSLSRYLDIVNKEKIGLYYGLTNNGKLEYGFSDIDKLFPIGVFKLTNTSIKWINNLSLKYSVPLKKLLKNLTYNNLKLLGIIKKDMDQYDIGKYTEKSSPQLNDNIISFGYKGHGKWINGNFSKEQYKELKENFIEWVLDRKWSDKVQVKIEPRNFWINIHLKLK